MTEEDRVSAVIELVCMLFHSVAWSVRGGVERTSHNYLLKPNALQLELVHNKNPQSGIR